MRSESERVLMVMEEKVSFVVRDIFFGSRAELIQLRNLSDAPTFFQIQIFSVFLLFLERKNTREREF